MTALVVIDADVLGRERTGDETYVRNLLRELPPLAAGRACASRRSRATPISSPPASSRSSSARARRSCAWPGRCRGCCGGVGAALVHLQYAFPLRCPCPAVVTVHDLSFERDPTLMGRRDRVIFRRVVPRAVRRAARVLAVSERTQRDLVDLYGVAPPRIVVTPNGVDPAFRPGEARRAALPALRRRDPAAQEPARRARRGPRGRAAARRRRPEKERGARARAPARRRATRGLRRRRAARRRSTAAPPPRAPLALRGLRAAGARGDGLRDAGRRGPEPALREVAGDAAVFAEPRRLADGVRRALAEREPLVAAGLERARPFTWARRPARRPPSTARCSDGERSRRSSSRTATRRELERSLPALAPQVDELVVVANVPGSVGAGRRTACA